MKTICTVREMQHTAQALRGQGKRIALVPTMGNLHAGHLELIKLAKQNADVVVVSIFVNPLQFGPTEDFASYPRTLDTDTAQCEREGADYIFHPAANDIIPPAASITVTETSLSHTLCGRSRPGHFDGVCTIVAQLFHAVLPHVAIFGEKDAQQLRIIRRLVRDLHFPVEILAAPTVRESDGLAYSSRNQHLTPEQRPQAACLHQALQEAQRLFAAGERAPEILLEAARKIIRRAPDARIDYIELVDDETLQPLTPPITRPALLALAVKIGPPRLIDNTRLNLNIQ